MRFIARKKGTEEELLEMRVKRALGGIVSDAALFKKHCVTHSSQIFSAAFPYFIGLVIIKGIRKIGSLLSDSHSTSKRIFTTPYSFFYKA